MQILTWWVIIIVIIDFITIIVVIDFIIIIIAIAIVVDIIVVHMTIVSVGQSNTQLLYIACVGHSKGIPVSNKLKSIALKIGNGIDGASEWLQWRSQLV